MAKNSQRPIQVGSLVIDKPSADEMASVGHISDKAPEDKAKHWVVVLRNSWRRLDVSWDDWRRVLDEVKADRVWDSYPTPDNPCGSLEALLKLNDIDPSQALDHTEYDNRRYIQDDGTNTLETKGGNYNPHGKKGKPDNLCYNCNIDSPEYPQRGNSSDYTLARLDRDFPLIAERVKRGELSRNAAAKEAGIRRNRPKAQFYIDDPIAAAKYLRGRVNAGWIATFISELVKAGA